jgi:Tol biopolymer transport system component
MLILALALLASACSDEKIARPGAEVDRVAVDPAAANVAVGDSIALEAKALAKDGGLVRDAAVSWSGAGDVASLRPVQARAYVRGLRAGIVVIEAAAGGKSSTATITVVNPAPQAARLEPAGARTGMAGLELSVLGTRFAEGVQATFDGQLRPTHRVSATELKVQLFPTDLDVAGEFDVTVSNPLPGGGSTGPLTFTVSSAPVATVTLTAPASKLAAGDSMQLVARAWDGLGNELDRPITWQSTDTTVARVSGWGRVLGIARGMTVISAASEGISASVAVEVTAPAVSLPQISALEPASVPALNDTVITIRGTGFVPNSAVFWKSSGHYADYISDTELRVALAAEDVRNSGKLAMTVFNPGAGFSNPDTLVITPALMAVQINLVMSQLLPGESTPYVAVAYDDRGEIMPGKTATWSSDQPGIARVSESGLVTGVSEGTTLIRAIIEGKLATAPVRVIATPAYDLLYEAPQILGIPELFVRRLDGSGHSTRLMAGVYASDPAVSRDGARIAYVGRDGAGNLDIYVVNRDGTNVRRLTNDATVDDQPSWSPDGTKLVFRSMRAGQSDIWIMNADGSGQVNLTESLIGIGLPVDEQPTFTADGSRIVFTHSDQSMNPTDASLFSMRADGSDARVLTDPTLGSDYDAAFSPDGQHLVVSRRINGVDWLRLLAPDGQDLPYFPLERGTGRHAAFAPDSRWIAVERTEPNGSRATFLTRVDAPDVQKLAVVGAVNAVWVPRQ